jgi:hypothetical protein
MTANDALVVAPYNAQVGLLEERLGPKGVHAGTVDRFQGQGRPSILAKLYPCFSQGIHHCSDGATLPAHLLCVECFQSHDGGDVNLGKPCEFGLIESG